MAAPTTIYPTVLFDKLDEFLLEFEQHDRMVSAGVQVIGEGAAYALVWEYGNVRQTQYGPRTVMGVNPDGTSIWMSTQAPYGYIATNTQEYYDIATAVLTGLRFDQPDAAAMNAELERGARLISRRMAEIVKDAAPKDTGVLARGIQPVDPGDSLLDTDLDDMDERTLSLDEE
jgi:hypothetical protein